MTEDSIRLRYAGLILFLSRIVSIGTGLIFTLLITRNITPKDYGIYGNIGDVLAYFTIISTTIPFWVTRFEARRWPGSFKTGFVINSLVGLVSTALYLLFIMNIIFTLNIDLEYTPVYLVAAMIIFEGHVLSVLEAALYSWRPEKIGFGFLIFETSKVALGTLLLYILRMGLMGAIVSVIFASLCQIIFYAVLLLQKFKEKIVWAYVREWVKASLLNIYGIIGDRLLVLANIFLFVYGGELPRAYYGASSSIASIVAYSTSLAFALYPRLLAGANPEDISLSLKMVFMFAIPMFFGAVILSKDLLSILNPIYGAAAPILIVLALSSLISAASSIFETVITGTENFDVMARVSIMSVFRSKLFPLLTLRYIQAAIILPPIYLLLSSFPLDSVSLTFYFASICCVGQIITTLIKLIMAEKCITFVIPWRSLVKYVCSSIVMALFLLTFSMPPRLIIVFLRIFSGTVIYFTMLFIVDDETRGVIRLVSKRLLERLP
ncbi:MAG: hypothetical protein QXN24_01730 [Candidatus Bathyarchaeia archaeon]